LCVVVDSKMGRVHGARGHGGCIRAIGRTVRPDSSRRTLSATVRG
jgi:hypothetical protein